MSILALLLLIFSVRSFAAPLTERSTPSFSFPGDVPFTVSTAALAAALTCPNGPPTKSSPPVLLVHGTSTTGQATWGDGYVPALLADGYTACYVTLPHRAMGDMQVSAEYVAYAIHLISYLSGNLQISIISHSQGGPDAQWALRFWPSTRSITRAFVPLSPDFSGIEVLGSDLASLCVGDLCQASLWQQSAGSNFLAALRADGFQALVPTTSIWTESDAVVEPPQQNALLASATVYSVQDLCPLRIVTHIMMPTDSAAYALALDALNHGGKASLSRTLADSWLHCFELTAPHMSESIVSSLKDAYDDLVDGFLLGSPRVSSEPPVMAYALNPSSS